MNKDPYGLNDDQGPTSISNDEFNEIIKISNRRKLKEIESMRKPIFKLAINSSADGFERDMNRLLDEGYEMRGKLYVADDEVGNTTYLHQMILRDVDVKFDENAAPTDEGTASLRRHYGGDQWSGAEQATMASKAKKPTDEEMASMADKAKVDKDYLSSRNTIVTKSVTIAINMMIFAAASAVAFVIASVNEWLP